MNHNIMKRKFISPQTRVINATGQDRLLVDIKVGSTVHNESDIGFAKRGVIMDDMPNDNRRFWDL